MSENPAVKAQGEERDALIASLGIEYSATFVPQSKSRNAGEKHPTLNWRVSIRRGRSTIETDYSQGIGHLPGWKHGERTLAVAEREEYAAESGKVRSLHAGPWAPGKALAAPPLTDVLYSLIMDAEAIDHPTYEDWAADFGYEADSRKGEAIYRACLEIGLRLRAMFGDENLGKLREAFTDY